MDGPVIQEATSAALAAGFRLRDTFAAVRAIFHMFFVQLYC